MPPGAAERVALGVSVHTGWAALVAVSAASAATVRILERRRLEMIPGTDPEGPRFVYHAARALPLAAAERLVQSSLGRASSRARASLAEVVEELRAAGTPPVACGMVGGRSATALPLESILRNHSAVHTAEGALFRNALRSAGEAVGLPVAEVHSKELPVRAARALGLPAAGVPRLLEQVGREAGRPWSKDQKDATLAALVALLD